MRHLTNKYPVNGAFLLAVGVLISLFSYKKKASFSQKIRGLNGKMPFFTVCSCWSGREWLFYWDEAIRKIFQSFYNAHFPGEYKNFLVKMAISVWFLVLVF
ncbi:MAG: hypothetical protein ABS949_09900 [Solibacillus sp.]